LQYARMYRNEQKHSSIKRNFTQKTTQPHQKPLSKLKESKRRERSSLLSPGELVGEEGWRSETTPTRRNFFYYFFLKFFTNSDSFSYSLLRSELIFQENSKMKGRSKIENSKKTTKEKKLLPLLDRFRILKLLFGKLRIFFPFF